MLGQRPRRWHSIEQAGHFMDYAVLNCADGVCCLDHSHDITPSSVMFRLTWLTLLLEPEMHRY